MDSLGIVTATRFWTKNPDHLQKLNEFLDRACLYSDYVIVAVRVEEDFGGTISFLEEYNRKHSQQALGRVISLPVSPWGAFTGALNALLFRAVFLKVPGKILGEFQEPNTPPIYTFDQDIVPQDSAQMILFQSVEIDTDYQSVAKLVQTLKDYSALVVGTSFAHSHRFAPSERVSISGLSSPWNTNALWHLPTLAKIGFLPVSDGLCASTGAGIEEVATITMLQRLGGERSEALLVEYEGTEYVRWNVHILESEERRALHLQKMESKNKRAEAQLKCLGVAPGTVFHLRI